MLQLRHCQSSSNKCKTLDELIENLSSTLVFWKSKENFGSLDRFTFHSVAIDEVPVDTGLKLNIHKTFSLRPVSTGVRKEIFNLDDSKATHCGSSHRRCSIKKAVLKFFVILTGKHLCWSIFLIKLQDWGFVTLLKRDSNNGFLLWILQNI